MTLPTVVPRSVRFEQDTDLIMFSPQAEHAAVLTHVHGVLTNT